MMNSIKREFTFTVLENDEPQYFSYNAYSIDQALYMLAMDGYSKSDIIETSDYEIHLCATN